jgi:hypothetical protein
MDAHIILRPVIRETMQLAPTRKWTAKALHAQLRAEYPDATEADILTALRWNQSKGYIDFTHHAELQVDHWHLTDRGLATPT